MQPDTDYSEAIEQYAAGGSKLRAAVAGLSPQQLQAFPVPHSWSIQQIVLHLQDSDLVGADRMKRIIAQDNPLLIGFDETRFAERLCYHDQSLEDALSLFEIVRRQFSIILRDLPPDSFHRTGVHNEVGKVTLGEQLLKYNQHLEHHLKFILQKRQMLENAADRGR